MASEDSQLSDESDGTNALAMPPGRRSINFLDMMGGDQAAEDIHESEDDFENAEDIEADINEEEMPFEEYCGEQITLKIVFKRKMEGHSLTFLVPTQASVFDLKQIIMKESGIKWKKEWDLATYTNSVYKVLDNDETTME